MVGEAGVRADDGVRGGIEGARGVGLLYGGVADGLRIELALDHNETGRGGDENVGPEVTGTTNAADGVTGGGEDIADEVFIVRAGRDRREVAAPFEVGASGGVGERSGAAVAIGRAPFCGGGKTAEFLLFTVKGHNIAFPLRRSGADRPTSGALGDRPLPPYDQSLFVCHAL